MNMMGEIGVVSIKVMTNKFTGEPSGYGFINFDSDQTAIIAMHRLGGKIIPQSNPPVRFKLNHNSTRLQPGEADTSIWVGDLTPEVDDFELYRFFCPKIRKYQVCQGGVGRVGPKQGVRLRQVRVRGGAAARTRQHDGGDGARQQAD